MFKKVNFLTLLCLTLRNHKTAGTPGFHNPLVTHIVGWGQGVKYLKQNNKTLQSNNSHTEFYSLRFRQIRQNDGRQSRRHGLRIFTVFIFLLRFRDATFETTDKLDDAQQLIALKADAQFALDERQILLDRRNHSVQLARTQVKQTRERLGTKNNRHTPINEAYTDFSY